VNNGDLGAWYGDRWYSNDSFKPCEKKWTFGMKLDDDNRSKIATSGAQNATPAPQSAFAAAMGGVTPSAPTPAQPAWQNTTWLNRLQSPVS
jgi:hypothetical protein